VPTGALNDVGNTIFINVDKSYRAGIELEGALLLSKWLQPRFNLTLSQNKIQAWQDATPIYDDPNVSEIKVDYRKSDIAFSPNIIGQVALASHPIDGLELELIYRHVGKQYLDNTQSEARALPAYGLADLRVAYFLNTLKVNWLRTASLSLLVNNITNAMYSSNGYTYFNFAHAPNDGLVQQSYNYVYPQAGTNFLLSLSVGI
jgi:iron complex outermembrane receptor protein